MAELCAADDECSRAWRIFIDDITRGGYYRRNRDVEYNEMGADPITKEKGKGDSVHAEEFESNSFYFGRIFTDKNKAYDAYITFTG